MTCLVVLNKRQSWRCSRTVHTLRTSQNKSLKRIEHYTILYVLQGNVTKVSCSPLLGKVYVSHIVDYLRHTTSRSTEDSGLEELCNMLDPEHKDVSIDLDTYHAVMREWIDDCRNNR